MRGNLASAKHKSPTPVKRGAKASTAELAARDKEIIAAAARGISQRSLAERFGISDRQVRNVIAKGREQEWDLKGVNPEQHVYDALAIYSQAIEELADISEGSAGNAKIGAIRTRTEIARARIELLQAVGALPRDLGRIRAEIDAREVARIIFDVFDAYGVPEEARAAIVDLVEGREVQLPKLPAGEREDLPDADVGQARWCAKHRSFQRHARARGLMK